MGILSWNGIEKKSDQGFKRVVVFSLWLEFIKLVSLVRVWLDL